MLLLLVLSFYEGKALDKTVVYLQAPPAEQPISGFVKDEQGAPVPFASVALYRPADSTMLGGTTTDDAGRFEILADPGRYYLQLSFLSYQPTILEDVVVGEEAVQLGTITLVSDAVELEEVEIMAEKDQLQLGLDKKIFNVSESLARAGGSAADILDNIPSVTVDMEGNVSLRGSQNVQVFVDGRPSGLVGVSSTQALRTFPADMIERVEVITNPSARYQAEGMAGIINIVLKKDRKKGINGSLDLTTGYPHNHGASANLNFRRKWYNLFTNYGIRYTQFLGEGFFSQEFSNPIESTIEENTIQYFYRNTDRQHNRGGLSNTVRLGSDFFLNQHNTLTSSFLYRHSNDQNNARLVYDYFGRNRDILLSAIRNDDETEMDITQEYNLNYRKTFEEEDRLLTADLQYRRSSEEENSDLTERLRGGESPYLYQRATNAEAERNMLLQLDYVDPFGEDGRWEAGLRHSFRKIDNDFMVEERNNGSWEPLQGFTNHLIYTEDIHAAYGIVGNKLDRFSYQLGLRTEYSLIRTESLTTGEKNPRSYLSFFPTAHFTYRLKENRSLEWSYSRRVNRPHFRQLNPFFTFSDALNIRSGNPNLDPEFTHSLEAGYLHHFNRVSLTSSIYYRHTSGVIQNLQRRDEQGRILSMPLNLATRDDLGFEFIMNADLAKWWKTNGNLNLFRSMIDAGNVEQGLSSDTYSWSARVNSRMDLSQGFSFQLTGFYRAPQEVPQGRTLAFYMVNTGLSKDILGDKGTLTLNVQDLFNSRKWRSETVGEDFISVNEFQWRKRQLVLNFTYRFNQQKERGERNRQQQRGEGGEEMDF